MKTIAITGKDIELKSALEKQIGNFEGLEIIISMPSDSQELIENISFAQPDFIITGRIDDDLIKNILDQCLDTTMVFVTEDKNRMDTTISLLNKEGYYNFINFDKNKIDPKGVLEQIANYNPNDIEFKEVEDDTDSKSVEIKAPLTDEMVMEELNENELNNNLSAEEQDAKREEILERTEEEKPISKPISSITEEIKRDYSEKVNSAKINAVTQCQVVSVYSKKGGTGKTTVAKEIANIFSGISLPKKLSDKEYLDVCLIDTHFEQADLRTMLGVTNANPSLYVLIDAYVSKMESGVPLDRIYFSAPEIKTNYCLDCSGGRFKLLCLTQDDIPKKLADRIMAFQDEDLLNKILRKIIKNLKDAFNVLIIDTSPSFNDINEMLFKLSSKIVYVLEPSLTDLDNLKTFLDMNNTFTNKIVPILNKHQKTNFDDAFYMLYEEIKNKNEGLIDLLATAPFDSQIINVNNNYGFYTNNQSKFKQALILACSQILPVFRVKNISQNLKIVEAKKKQEAKKAKEKAINEATKKFNSKESVINNIQNPEKPITENQNEIVEEYNLKDYLSSDLSKKSLNDFVSDLEKIKDIKRTKKGFPIVSSKPNKLDKKVWKAYFKMLSKNIK